MTATIDYVEVDTAPVYEGPTGRKAVLYLLWGDRVERFEEEGSRVAVRARGRGEYGHGWVEKSALGGKPLLELYFLDVGQGDSVLVKTPKGRHLIVDGGLSREEQKTGKSAADFVDWKFYKDYGEDTIVLDAIVLTHADGDHYGGLLDLLRVDEEHELDCSDVRVKDIYHAGLGWWKQGKGKWLGPYETVGGRQLFTQLVGDRDAIAAALAPGADPALHEDTGELMQAALDARWTDDRPTPIQRLSDADEYLPGFVPGNEGEPSIRVLAPLQFDAGGKPGLPRFDSSDSINMNGNSVVLRIGYGSCRILLTGDLNRQSQKVLLEHYEEHQDEFLCDVGKASHHGSKEVSFRFLQAMEPAVTVFSSGDEEEFDHPRPVTMAASAIAGYIEMDGEELKSPLLYSTELARAVKIGQVEGTRCRVVTGLVYGLVNVRTDGKRILCATRDEKTLKWRTEEVQSRFQPGA